MRHGHALSPTLRWLRWAVFAGAIGLALLLAAVWVAAAQFDACGASALDAVLPQCRVGVVLLLAAYAALACALVLGAVSLTLLWRVRRGLRGRRQQG